MSHPIPPSDAEDRAEHESLGEMFKSLSTNLSTLIQQEIALAKAEPGRDIERHLVAAMRHAAPARPAAGSRPGPCPPRPPPPGPGRPSR